MQSNYHQPQRPIDHPTPSRFFRITSVIAVGLLALGFSVAPPTQLRAQQDSQFSAAKTISTNLDSFGIPYKINADDKSFIEVQLYVSTDQGRSWKFHARQATNRPEFAFTAPTDGQYWFCLKTLDRNRHLLPAGKPQPELKIIVDRQKPKLDFRIESDKAGRVVCRWDAQDQDLDPKSIAIRYRADLVDSPNERQAEWQQVPIQLSNQAVNGRYADQLAWWPDVTSEQLTVQISIADHAGNVTAVDRPINVPQVAWRNRSESTARPNEMPRRNTVQPTPAVQTSTKKAPTPSDTLPSGALPSSQPSTDHQVANNVICENGVCRLIDPAKQAMPAIAPQLATNNPATKLIALPTGHATSSPSNQTPPNPTPSNQTQPTPPIQPQPTPVLPIHYANKPPSELLAATTGNRPANTKPPGVTQQKSIEWPSQTRATTTPPVESTNSTSRSIIAPIGNDPMATTSLKPPSVPSFNQEWNPEIPAVKSNKSNADPTPNFQETKSGIEGENYVAESTTRRRTQEFLDRQRASLNRPGPTAIPAATGTSPEKTLSQSTPTNQTTPTSHPIRETATHNLLNANPNPNRNPNRIANPNNAAPYSTRRNPQNIMRATPDKAQPLNSRRFQLNYGIDAIDPSGVQRVDLWMTPDLGQTWINWGTDPDGVSPFPVEVKDQGLYGFRIVIQSRDGLTGRPPSRGDHPDVLIQVDTAAPRVHITAVPYGRGEEAGRLVINWEATDPHLALRPITLAYSSIANGPWTTIEKGLRNTGHYAWAVGTEIPERLYLRIEAADKAGNIGVYQLNNQIDITGLVPRAHIRSIQPVKTPPTP